MSKKVKIILVLLGIGVVSYLVNGPSVTDEFLDGKWSDGLGSVYVFDCEGDDGYNPVFFSTLINGKSFWKILLFRTYGNH